MLDAELTAAAGSLPQAHYGEHQVGAGNFTSTRRWTCLQSTILEEMNLAWKASETLSSTCFSCSILCRLCTQMSVDIVPMSIKKGAEDYEQEWKPAVELRRDVGVCQGSCESIYSKDLFSTGMQCLRQSSM